MPVLELTPAMIGSERNRLTLSYIASIILLPADTEKRECVIQSSRAADLIEVFQRSSNPSSILTEPADLIEAMKFLADATPIKDVQQETQQTFVHGMIAGKILWLALLDYHTGKKRGLEAIKTDISKKYSGEKHFSRLSVSTINNTIWRTFRSVSHFWAAYPLCAADHIDRGCPGPFPCRLDDLPRFLAVAECLRRAGEACPMRQHAGTVLDGASTWRVPPQLALPEYAVRYIDGGKSLLTPLRSDSVSSNCD